MYTVVRCANCERCWGVMGKTRKCPHCGTPTDDKLQIVSVADNASDLQREVAIANMPESLRQEMRDKLPKAIEINENPSASQLFACIRIAVVDDIEQENKVYKMTLAQSMPNILQFNMRTNEISLKPQFA